VRVKIIFAEVRFIGLPYINMMNMYTSVEVDVAKTNLVMILTPKHHTMKVAEKLIFLVTEKSVA